MFTPFITAFGIYLRTQQNEVNRELLLELIKIEQHHALNLDSIQNGPFYSGIACLSDATKEHRTLKERKELVQQAKIHFISTLGMYEAKANKTYKDFFIIGYIQSYIGISWALLGNIIDAIDWITKSNATLYQSKNILMPIIETKEKECSTDDIGLKILGGASLPWFLRPSAASSINHEIKKRDELAKLKSFNKQTEDYIEFLDHILSLLTEHEETIKDNTSYSQYIPVAQKLLDNLAESTEIQNENVKNGLKKVSSFLDSLQNKK